MSGTLPPTQGVAAYYFDGTNWVPTTSSGGGGGGGAVTVANGADVTQGAIADAAYTTGSGTAISILKGIFTKVAAALTVQGTVAVSGTVPVSGTVSAAQSGTFTVQPGNTANTTEWLVNINGGTVNAVRGSITSTATTAATIIASPGTGVALFVSSMQISNTSTTQSVITLNDGAATALIVPSNGGNNPQFNPPLALAANTALTFTSAPAVTTILASAQGHKA